MRGGAARSTVAVRRGRGPGPGRVVGVAARVTGLDPHAFLALAPRGARGFWQRGGRWVAHGGVAAEVALPRGAVADRWTAVRSAAATWFGRWNEAEGRAPRLYGGLAYDDRAVERFRLARGTSDDGSDPEPLPSARFVLPALELESGPGGLTVRAWARVGPETDVSAAERRLRGRIREVLDGEREGFGPPSGSPPEAALGPPTRRSELPGPAAWIESVARLLARIERRELEKAVLARALDLRFAGPPDPLSVLARLRRRNPRSWPFFFEPREGAAVIGAAPELLVHLRGGRFRTMAVAGTAPRAGRPHEDARSAGTLRESAKERHEHALAVRELHDRLAGWAFSLRADRNPRLLRLTGIQHLRTDIRGVVPPGADVLSLLERLHPTAAVCGRPRDAAGTALSAEEAVERGWYAGPVGWFDARGDGVFAPALRSAQFQGTRVRLHAGAGVVRGSHPEKEWEETGLKLTTVLEALGLEATELDPEGGGRAP